ncbi:DUF2243 domain-containing protein [Orrella sp. JC864]|uniref:DUF2243 domain-containing protein n=1 Tax=Orrella sp. JC864 TaxID=3120298 RepID=UPI0030087136
MQQLSSPADRARRAYARGAFALGFALGGFFDGILLHQILQWHHLLSGWDSPALGELRYQVLADGLFHLGMYGVACLGLWWLYQGRAGLAATGAGRLMAGWAAMGFGLWHALDAVLSHWLLGLHRIRMDAGSPLAWDLAWLACFGLLPLLLGWRLLRGRGGPAGGGGKARAGLAACVAATLAAGWIQAFPLAAQPDGLLTVVLRPDASPRDVFAAMDHTGARVVWHDRDGGVWVLRADRPGSAWPYYRHGAMYVGGAWGAPGCAQWTRADLPPGRRI